MRGLCRFLTLFAIFQRRNADEALEGLGEVKLVAVAEGIGDLADGLGRVLQQAPGLEHNAFVDELLGGLAEEGLELA